MNSSRTMLSLMPLLAAAELGREVAGPSPGIVKAQDAEQMQFQVPPHTFGGGGGLPGFKLRSGITKFGSRKSETRAKNKAKRQTRKAQRGR